MSKHDSSTIENIPTIYNKFQTKIIEGKYDSTMNCQVNISTCLQSEGKPLSLMTSNNNIDQVSSLYANIYGLGYKQEFRNSFLNRNKLGFIVFAKQNVYISIIIVTSHYWKHKQRVE